MSTFQYWVDEYLEYCRVEKGLSDNSIQSYARDLKKLSDFGKTKSWEHGPDSYVQLMEFLKHLYSNKLSSTSVMRLTSTLRGFYRYLTSNGTTQIDPTAQIESPRRSRKLPKVLSVEQITRLLSKPDTTKPGGVRDRAMLELMYASGMRVSEVVQTGLQQLQLHLGFIYCYGKGSKERIAAINDETRNGLSFI